jgi:uncharacterized protein
MTTPARVAGLFVYPVKSMRAIACEKVRVTALGFEWDRQWMLVDQQGTFLSQRTHPQLARFVPQITADVLVVRSGGLPPLEVPLEAPHPAKTRDSGERIAVRVHRDPCVGVDQGSTAAQWASTALGETLRLVRVPPDPRRVANPVFAGATPAPMGFADGFPLLVCNEASLADLNTHLPEPIPMERFRPNLVLAGLPAWAEDRIDSLAIGAVTLRLVKPCTRCTIPGIDQRSGAAGTDPAPALRAFRFDKRLHGVTFGQNCVVASGAGCEVARGSPCSVNFRA